MTQQESRKGFSGLQVFGIAVLVMIVAVAGTIFAARAWFFPRPFKPVVLSQQEEKRLERKLELSVILTSAATFFRWLKMPDSTLSL